MAKKRVQKIVRDAYGKIAKGQQNCGCGTCGPSAKEVAKSIGLFRRRIESYSG
jgi:hypothetical protein